MEAMLLACASAILAVGVAVFLRLRRSIRETSGETAALRKRVTALEQRTLELEADVSASKVRFREEVPARPVIKLPPPPSAAHRPGMAKHSLPLTESQKELAEILNQLYVMNAQLPPQTTVEEKYIAEFDGIVERLERATGCDLSRWLGISPQISEPGAASPGQKTRISNAGLQSRDSGLFRLRILSLQAFCTYHSHHSQPAKGIVPPPPGAAGLVH